MWSPRTRLLTLYPDCFMYKHHIAHYSSHDKMKIQYCNAYKSVKYVKSEMLVGMGPSREQPSMCLVIKISQLHCIQYYRKGKLVIGGCLQSFNWCPITNKIRNPPRDVIVTYPSRMYSHKNCQENNNEEK